MATSPANQPPKNTTKNLAQWVNSFLEYCEIDRGHSALTVSNYNHYLTRFLLFCEKNNLRSPGELSQEVIHNYRLWLNRAADWRSDSPTAGVIGSNPKKYISSPKALSKATQNYHLIALRSFLRYLTKQDVDSLAPEKIELADTPDREITFLEPDELERLLMAPETNKLMGARDSAILRVLYSTGLRVAELTGLNREQVNLRTDELTVIGKGGKARLVFLSETARNALANYLKRRKDRDPALFVRHGKRAVAATRAKSPKNREKISKPSPLEAGDYRLNVDGQAVSELRLTPRTIQRIVKYNAKTAGVTKKVHPHMIRHSFATDLLGNGADIRSVQQLLGHSSITTTQIYTHVTNRQLRDVHRKFHEKSTSN